MAYTLYIINIVTNLHLDCYIIMSLNIYYINMCLFIVMIYIFF